MSAAHLLDHLAGLVHQECLSDLRCLPAVRRALLRTPDSAYPPAMWRDALLYLTGIALPDGSASDCKERLLLYYRQIKNK